MPARSRMLRSTDAELADVTFVDGEIRMTSDPSRHLSLAEVLRGVNEPIVSEVTSMPDWKALGRYSHKVHSAVFAEVRLDEELGMLRVVRVVSAVAAGRILNAEDRAQPDHGRRGRRHRHGAA